MTVHSITTSRQEFLSRVQAGRQDGRREAQEESVIIVAWDSLNDEFCFPFTSATSEFLFSVCNREVQKLLMKLLCSSWMLRRCVRSGDCEAELEPRFVVSEQAHFRPTPMVVMTSRRAMQQLEEQASYATHCPTR